MWSYSAINTTYNLSNYYELYDNPWRNKSISVSVWSAVKNVIGNITETVKIVSHDIDNDITTGIQNCYRHHFHRHYLAMLVKVYHRRSGNDFLVRVAINYSSTNLSSQIMTGGSSTVNVSWLDMHAHVYKIWNESWSLRLSMVIFFTCSVKNRYTFHH